MKLLIALSLVALFTLSCLDSVNSWSYREIEVKPQAKTAGDPHMGNPGSMAGMMAPDAPRGAYVWETPPGWKEEKGSGMRLATFRFGQGDKTAECSIIPLTGNAGGLESNVRRWMQQLNIVLMGDKQFRSFMEKQKRFTTKGGFPVVLIDFTPFLGGNLTSSQTGMAGIITAGEQTLFIKFFGHQDILLSQKSALQSLCKSINPAS